MNTIGAAAGEHPSDVLDEDGPCPALDDEAAGGWPKVPRVERTKACARLAMWLARDAAKDDVHASTKASARDGSGIAPYRRRVQETRFNRLRQMRDGEGFPLHIKDWTKPGETRPQREVQGAASCGDGYGGEVGAAGM